MDDPVYLRGRSRSLALSGDHVYVYLPDGMPIADFPVTDVARVGTMVGDDRVYRECIWFISPDAVVEDKALHRNPYVVEVDFEYADEVGAFTTALYDAVFERRRITVAGPMPGPVLGGIRLDLQATVAKLLRDGADPDLIATHEPAIAHYLRTDETVLGVADTVLSGSAGMIALTSARLIAVILERRFASDVGLQSVEKFVVEERDDGSYLKLDDLYSATNFRIRSRAHAEWLAEAGNAALDVIVRDGSVRGREPSSVELFEAHELLVERRQLGMLSDEDFGWQMLGVFGSVAGT